MNNTIRVKNFTGAAVMADSITIDESFQLKEIRIHLSAVGAGGNFTATVDSAAGAAYDLNIATQDMTSVVDYIFQPNTPMQFEKGDKINFAWANAGGKTYGLTVVYELL